MVTKATPAQAHALGFTTPQGTDLIRDGDNAISNNALTAAAYVLQLRAAAGGDPLPALPDPTGLEWVDVSLADGFASRSGQPVQVALDRAGMVHLRGHMDPAGFTARVGTIVFGTLPEAYWPANEVRWVGWQTTDAAATFGGYIATADGTICLQPDGDSRLPVPTNHFCLIAQAWPAAGGGAAINYNQRGTGSPLGVLTPAAAGITYTDTAATTGARQWISTGTTPADWTVTVGDTGWRSLDLLNGWTGAGSGPTANPSIRRVRNQVFLSPRNLTATAATNSVFATAPAGFIPATADGGLSGFGGSNIRVMTVSSSGALRVTGYAVTDKGTAGSISWLTAEPWPAVLPGEPA